MSQAPSRLAWAQLWLIRHGLRLSFWYALPALVVLAVIPTIDLLLWNIDLSIDWGAFKFRAAAFSLLGFLALGMTLCNLTFAYANASPAPEQEQLRAAARHLYTALLAALALMGVTFALNIYDLLLDPAGAHAALQVVWYVLALPGLLLSFCCAALLLLKFFAFTGGALEVLRNQRV